ncbi:NTPase [Pleomorphovibrio marinus]|uniref:NTPase n=1 Tax=Pleomorphovibrio marinus TaxID=2164132 RepID=UPI000E0C6BFA|nr:NTPase [Pleomorphovibrio marinus]
MKYIHMLVLVCFVQALVFGQQQPVEGFLSGKSAVLISCSPAAQPSLTWEELAEKVHSPLVDAGGDPVGYFELEEVALSEETLQIYANAFQKRLINNIIVVTRTSNGNFHLHIFPFSKNENIISPGEHISVSATSLDQFFEDVKSIGVNKPSENFLVIEIPEFPQVEEGQGRTSGASNFLRRKPLNLDVFKIGVLLSGASGDSGYLLTFRHDLFGKSEAQRLAEQREEREGLESVFEEVYPYQVEFINTARSNQELIRDRVQFMLMRIEGREGDIMENMGLNVPPEVDPNRIVVKYYVKFLVRNELYIGEKWDASPSWKEALSSFLRQISEN